MKKEIEFNGLYFTEGTNQKVMQIICDILKNRRSNRLRFWFGNAQTGKSWDCEYDVTGYIGKSTGNKPIPLLIHNINSSGGGGLITDCILKIVEVKTKRVLYEHEKFNQSTFTVTEKSDLPGYTANVLQDGKIYARCKKLTSAKRLADFMNGKRNNK